VPVRFGHYEFDAARRSLTHEGAPVHLTPLAFTLLDLLIADAPRVFTKEELHGRLWPDTFVSDAALTSLIKELRRALHDRDARVLIRTVNRIGYAFGAAIAESAPPPASRAAIHWVEVNDRRLRLRAGENLIGRSPTPKSGSTSPASPAATPGSSSMTGRRNFTISAARTARARTINRWPDPYPSSMVTASVSAR
jgi:DNA-binding winged helix-turn-helix (wHTH) protein